MLNLFMPRIPIKKRRIVPAKKSGKILISGNKGTEYLNKYTSARLTKQTKNTLIKLAKRKPKLFEQKYSKTRLNYQALFARTIKTLKKHGIEVDFKELKHEDEITWGHNHRHIRGIYTKTAEKQKVQMWKTAEKIMKNAEKQIVVAELYLKTFLEIAKSNGTTLQEFPSDIESGFKIISKYIRKQGETLIY